VAEKRSGQMQVSWLDLALAVLGLVVGLGWKTARTIFAEVIAHPRSVIDTRSGAHAHAGHVD